MSEAVQQQDSAPQEPSRVVGPGEHSVLFEDAQPITEIPAKEDTSQKDSEKQIASNLLKQVKEKENVQVKRNEGEKPENVEAKPESEGVKRAEGNEGSEQREGEQSAEAEDQSEQEQVKLIQLKNGEEDAELRADAVFKHKVNGEEVEVTTQELLDNYSGKVVWRQKFSDLAQEKKSFERDRFTIENKINSVSEAFDQDPRLGVAKLAEILGHDPQETVSRLESHITAEVEKMSNMTDEEKRAYELQLANERLKAQNEENSKQLQGQQEQAAILEEVRKLQSEHGVSDEEFTDMYHDLHRMKREGRLQFEKLRPLDVVSAILDDKAVGLAKEIIGELGIEYNEKFVNTLADVKLKNPDFTKEDIAEIAKESFVGKVQESISKKVNKTKSKSENIQKEPVEPMHQAMTFDELTW